MIRVLDVLRSLTGAFRPPSPRSTLRPPPQAVGDVVVTLANGQTPQAAVQRLLAFVEGPVGPTLLLPSMPSRPPSGAHPQVVAGLIEGLGSPATVGIPDGTAPPIRRRWQGLAKKQGANVTTLGSRGWDRIVFEREEFALDEVFVPAELVDAPQRIAIPALRDDGLVLGFWPQIVHAHTRFRVRGHKDRDRLAVELCAAVSTTYLLDASRLPSGLATNLVAWTDDPVAAELVGLGIRRHFETAVGYESVSPWESSQVQAATELGLGPASGSSLLLRADGSSTRAREIAGSLAEELGCRVEWLTEKE